MQTKTKTKTKKWVRARHKVIITLLAPFIFLWTRCKYHIKIEMRPLIRNGFSTKEEICKEESF